MFTVASVLCGLATTLPILICMRLVQAVGAAMLQANSVALVATSMPATRRRAALGVQAGAQALGLALGPTVGGLLIASVGWQWIFWINVPVGVVAVVAGWFLLPRTRHRVQRVGLDGGGLVLLAVASSALLRALSSVAGLPLHWWAIVLLAAAVVAAVAGLRWWERRATRPLFDPAVLSKPGVVVGLAGALLGYLVLFGPLVLFPEVAAAGRGLLAVGLIVTALPAGLGVAAIGAGRLLPVTWSDRRRCACGAAPATVAAAGLMVPVPVWGRVVLLGVLGVGLGVYIPANNAAVMALIPDQMAATAGGMLTWPVDWARPWESRPSRSPCTWPRALAARARGSRPRWDC